MTYNEAVTKLAGVRAQIAKATGENGDAGIQEYAVGGNRIVRAPLETLLKREAYFAAMVKRLNPSDGGGAVRQPDFGTRS